MSTQLKNYFGKSFELRFKDIIFTSLILLLMFRILLMFYSTNGLHNIAIYNLENLLVVFTFFGIILSFLLNYNSRDQLKSPNILIYLIILHVVISSLYLIQFLLEKIPYSFSLDDFLFIFLQLVSVLVFLIFSLQKSSSLSEFRNIFLLILTSSFFLYWLSKLNFFDLEISQLLLFLSNILFWCLLWILIRKYVILLFEVEQKKITLGGIILGILLGFGMTMGMSKSEVLTAVIATIMDQFFGLQVINSTIPLINVNSEFITILINAISGFVFFAVMLISIFKLKKFGKLETSAYFIIGLSGLTVLPFIGIIRILSISVILSDLENNNS